MIRVCVAGISGWVGSAVAQAVADAPDLQLQSGVARRVARSAGADTWGVPVHPSVSDALEGVDVLVDYTSHDAVFDHVRTGVERGVPVVVGSSGLSAADYEMVDLWAREHGVGVVAAGNFSLTAALAKMAAMLAARYVPDWEIVDYAYAQKPDAPSGTARELAEELGRVRADANRSSPTVIGGGADQNARGMLVDGTRIHSVRLGSFSVSTEIVFGAPNERLVIRHDAGESAQPYVGGTLLAVRAIHDVVGLVRGLDTLMSATA